jgi:hypothetical protein
MRAFLLSNDSEIGDALERYFGACCRASFKRLGWKLPIGNCEDGSINLSRWIAARFDELHRAVVGIEGGDVRQIGVQDTIVVVDASSEVLYDLSDWNPLREQPALNPLSAVLGLLVLALPEVQWVFIDSEFITLTRLTCADAHLAMSASALQEAVELFDSAYTPLFDPAGLRESIRRRIRQTREGDSLIAAHVPLRSELSASIDDESGYAFFTAYIAYRFGYRNSLVVTASLLERLFSQQRPAHGHYSLLLEDIYLRFHDQDPRTHTSDLKERDRKFVGLTQAKQRILITVGQRHGISENTWARNVDYIQERTDEGDFIRVVSKPFAGIFDVWKRSGLMQRLRAGERHGFAPGFLFPPVSPESIPELVPHSAPARLRMISDALINRSGRLLDSLRSVPEAVRASVLAVDALEYSGNLTTTSAFEALALKHQCEVLAECLFSGVQFNIEVTNRLAEVHKEISEIGRSHGASGRRNSMLNAEASVVSSLAMRFRAFNQFDEDQECMARLRSLYRHIWFRRRRLWAWIVYPVRWYVDWLLDSMWAFVGAIALWIGALAIGYATVAHQIDCSGLWAGLNDAVSAFLGVSLMHTEVPLSTLVNTSSTPVDIGLLNMLAEVLGFIHLGIFISHIYSLVTRR